jgi:hypothetical protein
VTVKLKQKAKYVVIGALAMTVTIPLVLKATDAIPLSFSQGDILSAEVLNTLFGRLNDVQKGFSSATELDGAWSCTVYDTGAVGTNKCSADGNLVSSKTGTLTFNANNLTYSWGGAGSLNDCGSGGSATGNYDVKAGILLTDQGVYDVRKRGPNEFIWFITNSMPASGFNVCVRQLTPPTPPTTLTLANTGTAVTLTWVDQSTDETGFKIQTKTAVNGTWTTVSTTAADVQSASATAAIGNNWYRVLATNANGDSMTSNEIFVEVE